MRQKQTLSTAFARYLKRTNRTLNRRHHRQQQFRYIDVHLTSKDKKYSKSIDDKVEMAGSGGLYTIDKRRVYAIHPVTNNKYLLKLIQKIALIYLTSLFTSY